MLTNLLMLTDVKQSSEMNHATILKYNATQIYINMEPATEVPLSPKITMDEGKWRIENLISY